MIASDAARCIIALTLALLAATQHLEIWHVYVASVLFGSVDAFFQPAYTAIVPEITPAEALPSANALTGMGAQFRRIAGPVAGAAIGPQAARRLRLPLTQPPSPYLPPCCSCPQQSGDHRRQRQKRRAC